MMDLSCVRICGLIIATALMLVSCEEADDSRIPYVEVNIDLTTQAYWQTYGVHSLGMSRTFIRQERVPSNFPYTAMTYTGFGGVLLVTDIQNYPLAYDLACPVEKSQKVRVEFDSESLLARCPVCHSEYNVCEFFGSPVSGEAYRKKWKLRQYKALPSAEGGYRIVNGN